MFKALCEHAIPCSAFLHESSIYFLFREKLYILIDTMHVWNFHHNIFLKNYLSEGGNHKFKYSNDYNFYVHFCTLIRVNNKTTKSDTLKIANFSRITKIDNKKSTNFFFFFQFSVCFGGWVAGLSFILAKNLNNKFRVQVKELHLWIIMAIINLQERLGTLHLIDNLFPWLLFSYNFFVHVQILLTEF